MIRKGTFYKALLLFFIILNPVVISCVKSQVFPAGFSQVQVASQVQSATGVAVAPDGRFFITQQHGKIWIFKNGNLLSTPFATLPVGISGERGLLGIALDPDFATTGYVYVHYTVADQSHNVISRITAIGDLMVAGSETIILHLDSLSPAALHNGGGMKFGPDGKLYISVGENTIQSNAQSWNTYKGKLLRINKDGSIPPGNPWTSGSSFKRRTWALGLRNPFSFDIQSTTGRIFVNDVGSNYWEEINDATSAGKNFGWPFAEGYNGPQGYVNPYFAYPQGSGDSAGCAITSGCFFNPTITNYPAQYIGQYFYMDYCSGWIRSLDISGSTPVSNLFASGLIDQLVCLFSGTDGNLYYISRNSKALYKIVYSSVAAPQFIQNPKHLNVHAGQSATFTVAVTGALPMSFQWKKNGQNIAGANSHIFTIPVVSLSDSGNYKCQVTNAYGSALSTFGKLTVNTLNYSPEATINSPQNLSTYSGGDMIFFSGSATDIEDGTIPAASFSWEIIFHHDSHIHPGPWVNSGDTAGSFMIPTVGETSDNVFYEIKLIVTDNDGATDTASTVITPNISNLTLNSQPQGAAINVEGTTYTTPAVIPSVAGVYRTFQIQQQQLINNGLFQFTNWSDGSTATTLYFSTPITDQNYTAYFNQLYRAPDNPQQIAPGLFYRFYKGSWTALPDFNNLTPFTTGVVSTFSLAPKTKNDNFGFIYNGFVYVPVDGFYDFYLNSDDGSRLYIGNQILINNDGTHAPIELSASIGLRAGLHSIRVDYFEATGGQSLDVSYSGPTITKQVIPSTSLFRYSGVNTLNPVADAFVRGGQFSNSNYGVSSSTILEVKNAVSNPDNQRETFLKFDLTKFPLDFTSVSLNCFGKLKGSDLSGCLVKAFPVADNFWNENAITYLNKPLVSGSEIDNETVSDVAGVYYSFDVTSWIQTQIKAGYSEATMQLAGTQVKNNYAEFSSKEAASNKPYLSFNFPLFKHENVSTTESSRPLISLFPNPSHTGSFTIMLLNNDACTIRLYDMNGRLVRLIEVAENTQSVFVENVTAGMYAIQVTGSNATYTGKILISNL